MANHPSLTADLLFGFLKESCVSYLTLFLQNETERKYRIYNSHIHLLSKENNEFQLNKNTVRMEIKVSLLQVPFFFFFRHDFLIAG